MDLNARYPPKAERKPTIWLPAESVLSAKAAKEKSLFRHQKNSASAIFNHSTYRANAPAERAPYEAGA